MVSVCLPSDAISQHLPSYLGFSYFGHGVSLHGYSSKAASWGCLLRNLYVGQEATVRTGHGTTHWFQIRKGVRQGCIWSPCLFNFYAVYIMRNAGLEKHKLESRLPGGISITSAMQMTPHLWKKWRGTKSTLDESEGGEWKSWLKAQHSEN